MSDIKIEDLIQFTMVNRKRGTKMSVQLRDENDDEVEVSDIMKQISKYIKDKEAEGNNHLTDQIIPLMGRAAVSGLGALVGVEGAAFLLSTPQLRDAIFDMMVMAFLLMKFVQKENLKIHTFIEEVSDEDINQIERKGTISSILTLSVLNGIEPETIIQALVDDGTMDQHEAMEILGKINEYK